MAAIHIVHVRWLDRTTSWIAGDSNELGREDIVRQLISGEWDDPLEVLEVDQDEKTTKNVSEDIARDIAGRREQLSRGALKFIERHGGMRLAYAAGMEAA